MTTAAASLPGRRLPLLAWAALLTLLTVLVGLASSATKPPLVTVTPTDGQTVSGAVKWTVESNGAVPKRVEFSVDGNHSWTEQTAPYDYRGSAGSLDTTALADGNHILSAVSFGANGSTLGSTSITVTVANNRGGGGTGSGTGSGTGTSSAPGSTTPPAVSGLAGVGQTLTATTGAWTNTPTSYAYRWQRCDGAGGACTAITDATSSSYAVAADDAGATLRVQVTATNASGQGVATSDETPVVAADLARGRPATASSIEASTLGPERAVDGRRDTRWSSAYQNYQWWQVDLGTTRSVDTVAVDWETAYASSYKIQLSADGVSFTDEASVSSASAGLKVTTFAARNARYVRVYGLIRATPWGFSIWEVNVYGLSGSNGGSVPPPPPPSVYELPEITGVTQVGSTLQASTGTWDGSPTAFAYQWKRCDLSGGACASIVGATTSQYVVVTADTGSTLRVEVVATNTSGSTSALSAPTAVVVAAPPTGTLGSRLPSRIAQSTGGQYYVDGVNGNDANAGTVSAPWRTINKAWQTVATTGSTINVRAGTYSGQVNLTNRTSSSSNPITVRAYPGESVKLTHTVAEYPAVFVSNSTGVRIQGFEITGSRGDGIKVANAADVEIVGNSIHDNAMQGVLVGGSGSSGLTYSKNVQLWGNRFYRNGGYWPGGSTYYQVGTHSIYYGNTTSNTDGIRHGAVGGVIANNLFFDQPYGFHIQVGSQNDGLIITSNTFDNAYQPDTRAGNAVQIYAENNAFATKNVVVTNNIIVNNANRGVHGAGPTLTGNVVRYNLAFDNPLGDFVPVWGSSTLFTVGPGNISGSDPRFVSQTGKDYRLQSSSPAIGRGDPAYAPSVDFAGRARDATPDLGAFEF
jgi:hypothetical protein